MVRIVFVHFSQGKAKFLKLLAVNYRFSLVSIAPAFLSNFEFWFGICTMGQKKKGYPLSNCDERDRKTKEKKAYLKKVYFWGSITKLVTQCSLQHKEIVHLKKFLRRKSHKPSLKSLFGDISFAKIVVDLLHGMKPD